MRVDEAYDLIVIGDQLSGLFLAAGAAQRGMKVLVLEESSFPTVLFEVPSGRFLADFMAEPAIGFGEGSPVDAFLKSLGLYQEIDQLFPRHEPPVQLVSPGLRLDFPYVSQELNAALEWDTRIPKGSRESLGRLLSGEVVSKKSFIDVVNELGLPVGFESLGALQPLLYGSSLPARLSYSDYREIHQCCARGVRFPIGGRGALKERLLARIQAFGGSLRRDSRVEELVFERKRLAGVLLSSYEGFVRSHRVVGAMAAPTFVRLVPPDRRPRQLDEAVAKARPRAWKLGFTLLVPEAVLPEGMGSHVALFDPETELENDGFLQLQVFPKDTYAGIPPRHRAVLGRMLVPFEPDTLTPKAMSTLLKRALGRVRELIPFLDEQPFAFFPDPDNLEKDPVYQRFFRFQDLSYIPGSLLVYERGFGDLQHPSTFLDWSSFGLPGLALCSRDIRPLHGLLGEVMSAMELLAIWKGEAGK
ncbi:MAG TPA: hypothetical protein VIH99_01940 [Bdellovibrionota bacterium]|jgi:hypothetical protein